MKTNRIAFLLLIFVSVSLVSFAQSATDNWGSQSPFSTSNNELDFMKYDQGTNFNHSSFESENNEKEEKLAFYEPNGTIPQVPILRGIAAFGVGSWCPMNGDATVILNSDGVLECPGCHTKYDSNGNSIQGGVPITSGLLLMIGLAMMFGCVIAFKQLKLSKR